MGFAIGAERQAVHLRVTGRVQGVGFRYFVVREARRLGLDGWTRNRRDGSVEIRAEGPDTDVQALIDATRRGPAGARVDGVEIERPLPDVELSGFEVRN